MWKLYVIAITLHFIFDWILQPRYIAKNKKANNHALLNHMMENILVFNILLFFILLWFGYDHNAAWIILINFFSHYIIDKWLPIGNNEREMINWTAIDQILHINIMIILLELFK